jgi:hypothetical protein
VSFVKRRINITFQLGLGGEFGESGTNTVTCEGLQVQASIQECNGPGLGQAAVRIRGLTKSLLKQLSSLNQATMAARRNSIIIDAGDDDAGMATVFQGQIQVSQIMLNTAPDTTLTLMASAGGLAPIRRVAPTSYPGTADAGVILQNLAFEGGLDFENNGVSIPLSTPYFPGDTWSKIKRCAEAGKIDYTIDAKKNALVITPRGGARAGDIPIISPETGMIGYPAYSSGLGGLHVTTLFNPLLRVQGQVQIQSDLEVANGTWRVFNLQHELESEDPGGQWTTQFDAQP